MAVVRQRPRGGQSAQPRADHRDRPPRPAPGRPRGDLPQTHSVDPRGLVFQPPRPDRPEDRLARRAGSIEQPVTPHHPAGRRRVLAADRTASVEFDRVFDRRSWRFGQFQQTLGPRHPQPVGQLAVATKRRLRQIPNLDAGASAEPVFSGATTSPKIVGPPPERLAGPFGQAPPIVATATAVVTMVVRHLPPQQHRVQKFMGTGFDGVGRHPHR